MLNIKSSSCRDDSVHQIMMHINIVELKTSDNQLGFFWNNKNQRSHVI